MPLQAGHGLYRPRRCRPGRRAARRRPDRHAGPGAARTILGIRASSGMVTQRARSLSSRRRLIGVLLTGMGRDGADAMTRLYRRGRPHHRGGGDRPRSSGACRANWCRTAAPSSVRPIEDVARDDHRHGGTQCRSLSASIAAAAGRRRRRADLAAAARGVARARTRTCAGMRRARSAADRRGGRRRSRPRSETEQVPRVREAIMTALMRIGDEASVQALLPYLRSQDAARRGAAIEALQALAGRRSRRSWRRCCSDDDSDVRILAVELVRGMPAADGHPPAVRRCWSASRIRMSARRRSRCWPRSARREALPALRGLRPALRRHAVPAVCHFDRRSRGFRTRKG